MNDFFEPIDSFSMSLKIDEISERRACIITKQHSAFVSCAAQRCVCMNWLGRKAMESSAFERKATLIWPALSRGSGRLAGRKPLCQWICIERWNRCWYSSTNELCASRRVHSRTIHIWISCMKLSGECIEQTIRSTMSQFLHTRLGITRRAIVTVVIHNNRLSTKSSAEDSLRDWTAKELTRHDVHKHIHTQMDNDRHESIATR